MEFQFMKDVPLDKRREQANDLLINHPNKVPIILEKDPKCKIVPINRTKYLLIKTFTINKFSKIIRSLMKIDEGEALFFLAKGKYYLLGEKTLSQIYNDYKDKKDGFLYISYSTEMTFG